MKRGWYTGLAAGIAGASALATPQGVAVAQDTTGLQIDGTVGLSVEIDDNGRLREDSDGTDTTVSVPLTLDVTSETPTTRFGLRFSGDFQESDLAGRPDRNGIQDQFVRLSFGMEGPATTLDLGASYREQDLDDLVVSTDSATFIDDDLLVSGGESQTSTASVALGVLQDRPASFKFEYDLFDREYDGTTDSDLYDRKIETGRATARFEFSPVLAVRVFAERQEYDAEDEDETFRTTDRYGLGADYDINPVLRFSGSVNATDIEERLRGLSPEEVTDSDGVGFDLGLAREMPNGELAFTATRTISTDFEQNTFTLRRSLDLPDGALSVSVGVSDPDEADRAFNGGVTYLKELPSGLFDLSVERSTVVNADDELRTRTFAKVGYAHEITPISDVRFGLSMAQSENEGASGSDKETNAEFRVTYSREMTEDWRWNLGYVGRYRDTETTDNAHSNAVVTSISRSFSLRP